VKQNTKSIFVAVYYETKEWPNIIFRIFYIYISVYYFLSIQYC
jgi:hypothetical protein